MKKLFILACMLVLFVCGAHAQQGKQGLSCNSWGINIC